MAKSKPPQKAKMEIVRDDTLAPTKAKQPDPRTTVEFERDVVQAIDNVAKRIKTEYGDHRMTADEAKKRAHKHVIDALRRGNVRK